MPPTLGPSHLPREPWVSIRIAAKIDLSALLSNLLCRIHLFGTPAARTVPRLAAVSRKAPPASSAAGKCFGLGRVPPKDKGHRCDIAATGCTNSESANAPTAYHSFATMSDSRRGRSLNRAAAVSFPADRPKRDVPRVPAACAAPLSLHAAGTDHRHQKKSPHGGGARQAPGGAFLARGVACHSFSLARLHRSVPPRRRTTISGA